MPDWSYHPLFKPILFRMSADTAKKVTLNAVSTLGSLPGGRGIIDFVGHMQSHGELSIRNFECEGRVGLGAGISTDRGDIKAFERFGFGFIEVGPVTVQAVPDEKLERHVLQHSISSNDVPANPGLDVFIKKHLPAKPSSIPLLVRVAHVEETIFSDACQELLAINSALPAWITALVIDSRWCLSSWNEQKQQQYFKSVTDTGRRIIVAIPPDYGSGHDQPDAILEQLISSALNSGAVGFSITGGIKIPESQRRTFGKSTQQASLDMIKKVRHLAPDQLLIGSGGVIEPADALAALNAGADLVTLYSGLVYSGPGLSKRINELLTTELRSGSQEKSATAAVSPYSVSSVLKSGWLGLVLLGLGLIVTGSSAITVALTTVILPYDESFLGATRAALLQINPKLLPFLSHDRVTYAGAGMSCGLLFFSLSYFGGRMGQRWAYRAALISCAFGFFSFLLFLGYHYFDPLHATVTLLLLPFFIWALFKPPKFQPMRSSNLHNTPAWHASLYGQLLFVCIGMGLILAGATICRVGTTTVFVPEDLMFMQSTANELLCHNEHLLPTIAHDRAGFGGTLVTAGIAVLLSALHGFRQGEGWIWWMLLISGLPGFISTLGIHYAIGYTTFIHLLPAYIATVMFIAGLTLSYRYLCVEPRPNSPEVASANE